LHESQSIPDADTTVKLLGEGVGGGMCFHLKYLRLKTVMEWKIMRCY